MDDSRFFSLMNKLWIVPIFLLFSVSTYSQKQQIKFESISVQQGLSDRVINCIIQDHLGFMWVGGSNGLYRYDGFSFLTYRDLHGSEDSSPIRNVYSLIEDEQGLLWILSDIGITIFDPISERSTFLYPIVSNLMNENVQDFPNLLMDLEGNIWAPFSNELIKITYKERGQKNLDVRELIFSERVREVFHIENISVFQEEPDLENFVTTLHEDQWGNIFAGCRLGIYVLQKESGTFIRIDYPGINIQGPIKNVNCIAQYNNKYLITSDTKLLLLEGYTGDSSYDKARLPELRFHSHTLDINQPAIALLVDRHGNCFMGTDDDLLRVHIEEEGQFRFESIGSKNQEPGNVSYKIGIKDIYEDRSGVIWIAQEYDGISKYNMDQVFFTSYKELVNENFKSSDINPIQIDNAGDLWIGTYGGGLYQVMPDLRVRHYGMLNERNRVICMSELKPGFILLGMARGVLEFNKSTGKSSDPLPDSRVGNELRESMVWDLQKVHNCMLIAATDGLFVFDLDSKQVEKYTLVGEGDVTRRLSNIISLYMRKNGDILASSATQGIFKVNLRPETKNLEWTSLISNEKLLNLGIDLSRLHTLYEDKKGQVWLTSNPGIYNIDIQNDTILSYTLSEKHEFPEARSIIEDDRGYFWIGTQYGLYRFSAETGGLRIFTEDDGLPISIHGLNSMVRKKDGKIVSGGIEGFYEFHPDSLRVNHVPPPVVITAMQVFDEQTDTNENVKSNLRSEISYVSSIDLKYNQNDFSIAFASLDYHKPLKNKYAYKLEGYQDDWIETDALNRMALYTKLKPGKYTFRVIASNGDKVWNEEGVSLDIIIHPPWWTSRLAWASYSFLFIILVWGFIRWRLWRLKKEKRELEFTVKHRTEEIEAQKGEIQEQRDLLEQQNEKIRKEEWLRSRFFENVSHEFRTPLTLIQNPVEELLEEPKRKEKDRRKLNMVLRNTTRLHDLVNQLLDISRLDASEMKLELQEGDVMVFLNSLGKSFISMAEVKSIVYQRKCANELIDTWFDADKLEKIIVNLLSNAFKYTEEGGEVSFEARYLGIERKGSSQSLVMIVKDTGVGISVEDQERIFDRFYQVEHKKASEIQGTGIGLSLVLDLVSLMHGEIDVQSESGKGSVFSVLLPLGKAHLKEAEFSISEKANEHEIPGEAETNVNPESVEDSELADRAGKLPLILIVEDNSDLRSQLRESLENQYNIIEAVDGLAGEKKALETIPDLILTDFMMPKMDGGELCRNIRSNELISHIPIIMLTAKDTIDDRISGLETGVDDYISKPFHMAELRARIVNLIQQREGLKARFSREITLEPSEITVTPLDEQLLSQAIGIVEEHFKDEDFNLDIFRQEMNLSRSSLSRKLHALTGQSPTEFIRTIRLKRAASLLEQNFGTITEVAFEVGFNNLSYFNRSFKKQFGKAPSVFIKAKPG